MERRNPGSEARATSTTPIASANSTPLRDYLNAVIGDTEGRLHIAIGYGGHWTDDKYDFESWVPSDFAWPAEADQVERELLAAATGADVYVCPYLMHADKRAKGAAVARRIVHADVDHGDLAAAKIRALDGFAVTSGTPGNGHVYVALSEPVPAHWHRALCRGLGDHLGGADAKITDNDVLRPPGTLNHKPTAAGGEPVATRWLVPPSGVRVDPHTLAVQLGVTLPTQDDPPPGAAGAEPVDLTRYPRVQDALAAVTTPPDRSADTMRVVGACYDAGLTLGQTRFAVNTRADLVGRLAERNDDDVATLWHKVDTDRRQTKQATGPAFSLDGPEPDAAEVIHSAHLGMAVKLAKRYKDKLLYVNKHGWYRWDGKRFAPDGDGAARRAVHKIVKQERAKSRDLPTEEREKRAREIARYETAAAISGILTEAAVLIEFSVEVAALDADPWLFNCANGTLDLRTMQLRPPDPADRITKVANAAYHPDTTSTGWQEFLHKVLPDEPVRDYLQRLTGSALLGEVNGDKQIAPIMTGAGANGKTTYIEAIAFALGDYAMTAEPTLLMSKRGDAHPTGIADLLGKRFVSIVETEQDRRFDIALLKWLTGGDTLKARKMRQDFFSFEPSHLLVMATNHLPRVDDGTEAVWRRIRVIPFTVEIPKDERDKGLKDRLRADADAVLGWVIAGWNDYTARGGFGEPEGVQVATDTYRAESDPVGRFIEDECHTGSAQGAAKTKDLYARWEQWAKADGSLPLSQIAFGRALDAKGFPAEKTHDRFRRKICLRKPEDAGL